MHRLRFALPLLLLAGCPSTTDQRAMEGAAALERCDLRAAHTAFSEAHDLDPDRSDVALAYALTDLATLVEDPAFEAIAPRVGFDRPLDSSMLWGPGGLLERLSRGDGCDTFSPWFRDTFPHRSARSGGPEFWSTVDETLTLGEIRTVLVTLQPRLTRVARALELAASNMESGGVSISGGCGLSSRPTRLQAPELFALAAVLHGVVAVTEVARGYDGSLSFALLFRGSYMRETEWVTAINAGFLRPTDPAAIQSGRAMLAGMAEVGLRAVAAARVARAEVHPADAIFDWTVVPADVLDDVQAFGDGGLAALRTDGPQPIPRLTPALGLDVGSFFTAPFDGTAEGPLWSLMEDPPYSPYIRFDGEAFQRLLTPRFDSDPWAMGAPSRSFEINWSDTPSGTWEQLFDPGDRWSTAYRCTPTGP